MANRKCNVGVTTRELKPNAILGRTVWSSPQHVTSGGPKSCSSCQFFADSKARVSQLTLKPESVALKEAMTFGFCQNVRIWAAFGKEKPPITRSYHYCNYYKEKDDGM